jgi:hypothetical protein
MRPLILKEIDDLEKTFNKETNRTTRSALANEIGKKYRDIYSTDIDDQNCDLTNLYSGTK